MRIRLPFRRATTLVILLTALFAANRSSSSDGDADARQVFSWRQTDVSLALLNSGKELWRLNYGPSEAKPSFHPVNTLEGTPLTSYRPADHPWHRALWFSWKTLNGINYWEEDPDTGRSDGVTEMLRVKVTRGSDHSAAIEMKLSYHPKDAPPVLTERRILRVSRPSEEDGSYRIDWHSRFTAGGADVLLGRTPIEGEPDGKSWGGYAGLSVRLHPDLKRWTVLDSASRRDLQANRGHARWLDFRGLSGSTGRAAGIAIFDHPGNPRHPTPWYVIMGTDPPFGYFSPAILYFHEHTLTAGSHLDLRYRILIHAGVAEGALENEWAQWAAADSPESPRDLE